MLKESGIDPKSIRAVAVCGHGKGLYLWGKDGRPVRPGILSTDNRAYAYPEKWRKSGAEAAAFRYTCQHILASQPTSLLAWLADNEPWTIERTKYIFACKDYIRFRLSGEACAELTDYSGDGFVNLYTGDYDGRILRELGLSGVSGCLPPLVLSTERCGYVSRQAAIDTGLAEGTPIAGGMFDIDACAIAAGVTDTEHACMVAGTWSINELLLSEPVVDGRVLMNSMYCLPGYYLVEESSPTSAGNLAWYIKEMLKDLQDFFRKSGGNIYDEDFKEVLVRWFEFGAFCPVFRLHGFREPFKEPLGTTGGGTAISGAENEVWSYGEEVYEICKKYLELRERMLPYVKRLMAQAHEKGTPVMRPLFYDFPEDGKCWEIEDEYMFGPEILVAPILYEKQRERKLYLPAGEWRSLNDGKVYAGGADIVCEAPIDAIPVFVKNGCLKELKF